ncbi:MAG: hypothetical protein K6G05_08240 [Lachnospiraceae bacterium]|nr:hypothetical protein [Lachnospiraceae bacterium]
MRSVDYNRAKEIMGENFIGLEDIKNIDEVLFELPDTLPEIPYSEEELEVKKEDYLLILAVRHFEDGCNVTIRNFQKFIGKDPEISEPCFYNQDWYEKEGFIDVPIKDGWLLIRKNVYEDSRAVQPSELMGKYTFPKAISCVYAFFVAWYAKDIRLWYHDFVWCSDTDHNGDHIYVGKYHDVDGVNKNGFSIHRHLALRPCYACID